MRSSVNQLVDLVHIAINTNYLISNFGPYQVTGDATTITVTITPVGAGGSGPGAAAAGGSTTAVAVPARAASVRTTRGFKIDFSAGLLVTELVDENYVTKPNAVAPGATQTYTIAEGSSDDLAFNGAAFTHFYWRRPGFISGLGLSLGIAARNNPIYAVGGSLFFGSRQRVVLTGGLAFGSVSRLNGAKVGDVINSTTPPTANRIRSAPFAALSFNF